MTLPIALMMTATLATTPVGIELDCKSWPGIVQTELKITVLATDGVTNVGRVDFDRNAKLEGVQLGFIVALEQEDWVVKAGANRTVLVFAPKGKSVKSIKFDSTGWIPVYRRVLVPPSEKN